jgi:hypothetical protein
MGERGRSERIDAARASRRERGGVPKIPAA